VRRKKERLKRKWKEKRNTECVKERKKKECVRRMKGRKDDIEGTQRKKETKKEVTKDKRK
jgi:hypothetical protein